MAREPGTPAKPLEWSPRARDSYAATLAYIAEEDPVAAQQVKDRVERALRQIAAFPGIGTPGLPRGIRRFAIPNTGHVVNYRILRRSVRIQSWYRARQQLRR